MLIINLRKLNKKSLILGIKKNGMISWYRDDEITWDKILKFCLIRGY